MSKDSTTVLRLHKNRSQRQTFEMPCDETDYVRRSTTHETYRPRTPVAEKPLDDKEKRRKELKEHLWKKFTEQVLNDLVLKANKSYDQNNHFETTYSSTFKIEGFRPKELGEALNDELCAKYPLYRTNGMSVPVNWYECYKAKQSVHKSLEHLFKRDSRFTSRMSNPNDCHSPVDSGHFAFV